MQDSKYEQAMIILKEEMDKELTCATITRNLLNKTKNPFKRVLMKKRMQTFLDHSVGIDIAIRAIQRKIES